MVFRRAAQEGDGMADLEDFIEHRLVPRVHADSITERQSGVQSIALDEMLHTDLSTVGVVTLLQISNNAISLEIKDVEVFF